MHSISLLTVICLTLSAASACPAFAPQDPPAEPALDDDERMEWWREARFGLFIHWGLYSIPAGEWNGQTRHGEWIRTTAQIPIDEYDQFVGQFNPVEFDADQWVRLAKAAGMRYIVITSKHHDGFGLFDSEHTDYDVMSTPFGRDILKELADACDRHGLRMCWYHSIMDWHHPDYLPRRDWETRPADDADYDRFVEYLHGQVTELLTNYGDIGVMWFDGEWEGTWEHEQGLRLYELCRSLQPNVIVNNRVDKGRAGMAGMTTDDRFAGDFGTPEQEIPETGLAGVDWETCMTMNRHWGYNKNDDGWKSSTDLIRKLCDIASKGGNFLLNVGPRADGTFPDESVERLGVMGNWMSVHGEAIHGTSASPFEGLSWGRCTVRREVDKSRLYMHVFDWPEDRVLRIPNLGSRVRRAYILGQNVQILAATQRDGLVSVELPIEPTNEHVSVVVLEIEGAPIVYRSPEIIAPEMFVNTTRVAIETGSDALELRCTVDGSDPTAKSPDYIRPIAIGGTTTIKARSFHEGKPVTEIVERTIHRVIPKRGLNLLAAAPGLHNTSYQGDWDTVPDFGAMTAGDTWITETVERKPGPTEERYGLVVKGYLAIDTPEVYTLALTSDDGSRLFVHDELVIDHDGLHGSETKAGHIALGEGFHPIRIEYFNKTGSSALDLLIATPRENLQEVPASMLHRDPTP